MDITIGALQDMGKTYNDFASFTNMFGPTAFKRASEERLRCIDQFEAIQDELIPFAVLPLGHPHQGGIEPVIDVRDSVQATSAYKSS